MFVPVVVMSDHLFCGAQGHCVRCQMSYSLLSSVLFWLWHPSIVIGGRASSDQLLGPMPVSVH